MRRTEIVTRGHSASPHRQRERALATLARYFRLQSQRSELVVHFGARWSRDDKARFKEVKLGAKRVPVQFLYSNAAHGAEGPIDTPHSPVVVAKAARKRAKRARSR